MRLLNLSLKLKDTLVQLALTLLIFIMFITALSYAQKESPTLEDGLLGLSREEIKTRFGKPIRIVTYDAGKDWYYTPNEWETVGKKIHDSVGDDVYRFERNNNEIEYRFLYGADMRNSRFHPIWRVKRYWVKFDKAPLMKEIPKYMPEISPLMNNSFTALSSYFLEPKIIFRLNSSSKLAGLIANGYEGVPDTPWALSYEVMLEGEGRKFNEIPWDKKILEVYVDVGSPAYVVDTVIGQELKWKQ